MKTITKKGGTSRFKWFSINVTNSVSISHDHIIITLVSEAASKYIGSYMKY
jgi:hypothetical protein